MGSESIESRAQGCLLGLASGNLIGLPWEETWPAERIRELSGGRVRGWDRVESERPWDDDTAQAMVVAELLGEGPLALEALGRRLLVWKQRNGRGIRTLVDRVLDDVEGNVPVEEASVDAFERLGRNWSATNTAVVRAVPVALRHWDDPARILEQTAVAARATHWNPLCVWSASAFNLAISAVLRDEPIHLQALAEQLRSHGAPEPVCSAVSAARAPLSVFLLDGKAKSYTLKAMQVGLWSLLQPLDDLEASIEAVVLEGGDTGTNAAIAGAALGVRVGREGLPSDWISGLREPEAIAAAARALVRA